MDAEQINAACAERMGWVKEQRWGGYSVNGPFVWEAEDGTWYDIDCFTTATPEWCEHVLMRVAPNHFFGHGEDDEGPAWEIWRHSDGVVTGKDPDLYLAVAAAFVEMKKGE